MYAVDSLQTCFLTSHGTWGSCDVGWTSHGTQCAATSSAFSRLQPCARSKAGSAWQTNLKPFAKFTMRNQRIVTLRSRQARLCAHIAFARDFSVSWGPGATATSTNGACDASKRPDSARTQLYATNFRCLVAVLRCCQGCGATGAAQTSNATGPRQQLPVVACRLAQGQNGSFARF